MSSYSGVDRNVPREVHDFRLPQPNRRGSSGHLGLGSSESEEAQRSDFSGWEEIQRMHHKLYQIIGEQLPPKSIFFEEFKQHITLTPRDKAENDGSAEKLLRVWEFRGHISPGNYGNLLQLLDDAKLILIRNLATTQIDLIRKQFHVKTGQASPDKETVTR